MEGNFFLLSLFLLLLTALLGSFAARMLRLPVIVGYVFTGIVARFFLPFDMKSISLLSEVGIVLLLFSVGLELSLDRLLRIGKIAVLGGGGQIVVTTFLVGLILGIFGVSTKEAYVLALGFSLSSTALVVKILEDRGEMDSWHGEIMTAWLLVQDLAVVPIMAIVSLLSYEGTNFFGEFATNIGGAFLIIGVIFFLGRLVAPYFIRVVSKENSRELLLLSGITLALGTAYFVSLFGVSAAIGAFLAGIVISETQEKHALFSETRPLRDIFTMLFFVTLGFLVSPSYLVSDFLLIVLLAVMVIVTKAVVVSVICYAFSYRGRTMVISSLGMAQVGEFSFVLFLTAQNLGIFSERVSSVGIATTLLTITLTPYLFKLSTPTIRMLKKYSLFADRRPRRKLLDTQLTSHVIICGYGRVGKWVGRALTNLNVNFSVIDYNQSVVRDLRQKGVAAFFGDASEPLLLGQAGVANAKAVIIAISDTTLSREIISFCENNYPDISVIARAHLDEDVKRLSSLKIRRVVQPEFEAALACVKEILKLSGKSTSDIQTNLASLRRLHTSGI